jgi:hypothetical protein
MRQIRQVFDTFLTCTYVIMQVLFVVQTAAFQYQNSAAWIELQCLRDKSIRAESSSNNYIIEVFFAILYESLAVRSSESSSAFLRW